MIERVYYPYTEWEDYGVGMYRPRAPSPEDIFNAARILSHEMLCREAMRRVVREWPVATAQNLSDPSGRRPWLGRAAVCIATGLPESVTRSAWNRIHQEAQNQANTIADEVIGEWLSSRMEPVY